jgi:hypothetical protein
MNGEALKLLAEEWANTPAGKAAIENAMREANELTERLEASQRVDPEILKQPMTI